MQVRFLSFVALVAAAMTAVRPLAAQNVLLTGTAVIPNGFVETFSFLLPQTPAPTSYGSNYFTVTPLSGSVNDGSSTFTVPGDLRVGSTFLQFTGPEGGTGGYFGELFNDISTLYTGPTSAPTFVLGNSSFYVSPVSYGANVTTATISAVTTTTTTPEPSSLALLATGLAAVAPIVRRKWA